MKRFIVFEGIDASGKETQAKLLSSFLSNKGFEVMLTHEPIYDEPIGKVIKSNLEKKISLASQTVAMLYAADRHEHYQKIKKALAEGKIVISDRYKYSNMAYQGANGVDPKWIQEIEKYSLDPDIIFYIRVRPESAMKRRKEKDLYEENIDFQKKVFDIYESLSKKYKFITIDGERSIDEIHKEILEYFD
ncbi:MAG: putative thymidylate kinase [Candidatus Methanofastidiosum methylothiophilum]|uniref:Probable thymidylate kinase n=1 Tax=Candidatus Methanofastidiosum methylothiophilum TaxID=1705564 RepID=A0A150ITG5_9EURY|nr:MAG: putative thymidylate kinase [Candidatus Methanofastidiosum methylthiophilus]KYC48311.1 MAG: putative thymidylate kinase [Candidatus Methanofastidiosum methylthiophilus]KYC50980.1 MAG: putative thymidylate kinase [Candidatus Methanofastidiosum methylthiophilus]